MEVLPDDIIYEILLLLKDIDWFHFRLTCKRVNYQVSNADTIRRLKSRIMYDRNISRYYKSVLKKSAKNANVCYECNIQEPKNSDWMHFVATCSCCNRQICNHCAKYKYTDIVDSNGYILYCCECKTYICDECTKYFSKPIVILSEYLPSKICDNSGYWCYDCLHHTNELTSEEHLVIRKCYELARLDYADDIADYDDDIANITRLYFKDNHSLKELSELYNIDW